MKCAIDESTRRELGIEILYAAEADRAIGCRRGEFSDDYDFALSGASGAWEPYKTSQDCGSFGVWVNKADRLVFSYAEGDRSLVRCPDQAAFDAWMRHEEEFYRLMAA